MTNNLLETESFSEIKSEMVTYNSFLKKAVESKNLPIGRNGVISRNTENRNNKVRVLKSKPCEHKYKQYYISAKNVG